MNADRQRVVALGQQLVEVHDGLRAELDRLRSEVRSGSPPGSLAAHCLAFCAALSRHHTGEDDTLFPAVEERHPELAGLLAQLREDHHLIASLLTAVQAAVAALPPAPDEEELTVFGQQLDGIGAIAESHFRFEERRVRAVLDGWGGAAPAADWFGEATGAPAPVAGG